MEQERHDITDRIRQDLRCCLRWNVLAALDTVELATRPYDAPAIVPLSGHPLSNEPIAQPPLRCGSLNLTLTKNAKTNRGLL
jgi:hypothetical protein